MKTSKNHEIKIRVTEHEKNILRQSAASYNETMSSYILRKCLCTDQDLLLSLPQRIDACNFFNEIYHRIEKYGSESLKQETLELYKKYVTTERKDVKNEDDSAGHIIQYGRA